MAPETGKQGFGNVWVVGASSGIGRHFAELIDGRSRAVAISARSADKLGDLERNGRNLKAFPLDISQLEQVAETTSDIVERLGSIELAVITAATWVPMVSSDMDPAAMRDAMDINYFGVVNVVYALVPVMKEQGHGHIVILSSVAGYRGLPQSVAYGPTKAALIHLAEILNLELRRFGIRISVVCPGFVDTPLTRGNPFPMPQMISPEKAARQLLSGVENGRFEIVFPWPFAHLLRAARLLPNWLYFRLVRRFVLKER